MYTNNLTDRLLTKLKTIIDRWQMSPSSEITLLNVSENATFLAYDREQERKIVLRVHRDKYHNYDEIRSELAWINILREQNIVTTAKPLSTTKNEVITTINDGEIDRYVVAFEFLAGHEPEVGENLADWFYELGIITAKLHQHSKQWQRPDWFIRKKWSLEKTVSKNGYWGDWRQIPSLDAAGIETIENAIKLITSKLAAYGQGADKFGLIHADLRLANLLIDHDKMGVIDFDDCGFSWFAYDFAAAISFHELDPMVPQLKDSWIKGYRSIASFTEEDEQEITTFIMLRRILLTAWLASHGHSLEVQQLGLDYTPGTVTLAEQFIKENSLKPVEL